MALYTRLGPALLVGLGLTALAPTAGATDNRIRSAVVWTPGECATLVDRSVDPVVNFAYMPAFEDPKPGPGEVADGRRFQFFATCRGLNANERLPTWITQAEVDEAGAIIADFDATTVLAAQILDDAASGWPGCAHRINDDDARIPITFADAANGIDWDTSGVPAGVYVVHGYIWDPTLNDWWARPGFVKVHDGDPSAAGPAVAITSELEPITADEVALLQGCVDASASATLDVYWSRDEAIDWQPYLQGEPVVEDEFAIEFVPPPQTVAESILIRVDVVDGGQTYTAHLADLLTVLEPSAGGDCEGGFVPGPDCPDTDGPDTADDTGPDTATSTSAGSGSATSDATTSTPTSAGADSDEGGGSSCACRTATTGGTTAWLWLGLAAFRRRRRVAAVQLRQGNDGNRSVGQRHGGRDPLGGGRSSANSAMVGAGGRDGHRRGAAVGVAGR